MQVNAVGMELKLQEFLFSSLDEYNLLVSRSCRFTLGRKVAGPLCRVNCAGLRAGLDSPMGKIKSQFLSEIQSQLSSLDELSMS
jgi:hypothetical protein